MLSGTPTLHPLIPPAIALALDRVRTQLLDGTITAYSYRSISLPSTPTDRGCVVGHLARELGLDLTSSCRFSDVRKELVQLGLYDDAVKRLAFFWPDQFMGDEDDKMTYHTNPVNAALRIGHFLATLE